MPFRCNQTSSQLNFLETFYTYCSVFLSFQIKNIPNTLNWWILYFIWWFVYHHHFVCNGLNLNFHKQNFFSLHIKWKASVFSTPGPLCMPQCYSLFAQGNACVSLRSGPLPFSGVGYTGVYACVGLCSLSQDFHVHFYLPPPAQWL